MTPDHDTAAIAALRRDVAMWRLLAKTAVHSLAAEHRRVVDLEAQLRAAREEAGRYARRTVEARRAEG